MSFSEAMELDCYTYKVLVVDAFVDKLGKTEEGREYLEKCWILTQTKPDKNKLRRRFME